MHMTENLSTGKKRDRAPLGNRIAVQLSYRVAMHA